MNLFKKKNNAKSVDLNVNVEIDYDKLGQSIANALAEKEREEAERYSVTREWLKSIMQLMIFVFAVLMATLTCYLFYRCFVCIKLALGDYGSINIREGIKFFVFFGLLLISLGLSLMAFFANHEIGKELDRRFISSLFSNVVALVALVIALLALVKDMW